MVLVWWSYPYSAKWCWYGSETHAVLNGAGMTDALLKWTIISLYTVSVVMVEEAPILLSVGHWVMIIITFAFIKDVSGTAFFGV